jgi:hypothetical protein
MLFLSCEGATSRLQWYHAISDVGVKTLNVCEPLSAEGIEWAMDDLPSALCHGNWICIFSLGNDR